MIEERNDPSPECAVWKLSSDIHGTASQYLRVIEPPSHFVDRLLGSSRSPSTHRSLMTPSPTNPLDAALDFRNTK